MPKFKFEAKGLKNILEEYAELRKQTIPDAVVATARLLCVELARRTQPFGDKDDAKKSGEKAITRDLRGKGGGGTVRAGIFGVSNFEEDQGFAWYDKGPNVRLFITKDGRVYGTDKSFFRPDASEAEMRKFHKSKFSKGKMSSAGGRDRSIGRWKFIEKMFVDKSTLDKYIDSQILKVGWAKSAWAACARELRKVTSGSATRGIPSWVTRHDSPNSDVIDNSRNLTNPSMTLINKTKYASQVLPANEVNNAKAIVISKMINQMKNILKKRKKDLRGLEG
jgi:hypothetical protein